jgi:hypothetical protein
MPVEVRELIIRAQVSKDPQGAASSPDTTSNNGVTPAQELMTLMLERVVAMQNCKNDR